jgi:hypothetical protein
MWNPFGGDHGSIVIPIAMPPCVNLADILGVVADVPNSLRSDLCLDAFNAFSTQFPQSISLGEFLLGLGELKALLPSFSGSILKDLSDLYLKKKFGWDNLVSDLKAFDSMLSRVRKRLKWLRDSYGRPTRLGFYRRDVLPYAYSELDHNVRGSAFWIQTRLVAQRTDFRAGAWLTHYLEHLDDAIGWIRALAGDLGLNNPVKAVWESLPYSFVLDWFLGISNHLDRLTQVRPAEVWQLDGITHSFKTEANIEIYQFADTQVDPEIPRGQFQKLCTVQYQRYERLPNLPVGFDSLVPSSLQGNQLVLFLCMLNGSTRGS